MKITLNMPMPSGVPLGIGGALESLRAALAVRPSPLLRARAWGLAEAPDRAGRMTAFVDELHLMAAYRSLSVENLLNRQPPGLDADDACVFVAVLAKVVGIPCKFVAARAGKHSWTVFLAYEDDDGLWVGLDVMRSRADVIIEELVFS